MTPLGLYIHIPFCHARCGYCDFNTYTAAELGTGAAAVSHGSYPDLDGLFQEQAGEMDRKRREAVLHRMQQLIHEKVVYAPIWELAFLNGVGPRVQESGLGLISGHAYSAPYEDLRLKKK